MKIHTIKCKTHDVNFAAGNVIPRECNCDGFHTFDELYDHRNNLFIALCRFIEKHTMAPHGYVWRSKKHFDESEYVDWFILGISKVPGDQITYHLPNTLWNETEFAKTLEKAPEWDRHSSDDVISRIKTLWVC